MGEQRSSPPVSPGSDPTDRAVDTIAADSSLAAQSIIGRSSFSVQAMQHGGSDRHLPATRQNIELVGKLQVNTPAQYRYNPATGCRTPRSRRSCPSRSPTSPSTRATRT